MGLVKLAPDADEHLACGRCGVAGRHEVLKLKPFERLAVAGQVAEVLINLEGDMW